MIRKIITLLLISCAVFGCNNQYDIEKMQNSISLNEVLAYHNSQEQAGTVRTDFPLLEIDWNSLKELTSATQNALLFSLELESGERFQSQGMIHSTYEYTYALAYKDRGEIKLEFIQLIRENIEGPFSGRIYLHDWFGESMRVLRAEEGDLVGEYIIESNSEQARMQCVTVEWWTCYGDAQPPQAGCHLDNVFDICSSGFESLSPENSGGGFYEVIIDQPTGNGGSSTTTCNPETHELINNQCVPKCPFGYELIANNCLQKCPNGSIRDEFNNCIPDDCNTRGADLEKTFEDAERILLDSLASILNKFGKNFGINTKEKLQHFLTQSGHETGGFQNISIEENLNYSSERLLEVWPNRFSHSDTTKLDPDDYANNPIDLANQVYCCRNGNGNVQSGDGYAFRGRGIFQLTGRSNYSSFNAFYQSNYDSSINILDNPELISTNDVISILSALWFFEKFILDKINIDENTAVADVTIRVNGGTNGLADRQTKFENTLVNIDCHE